jgi:hypothetical protein
MTPRAYYNEIDPFCAAWLRNLITAGWIMHGKNRVGRLRAYGNALCAPQAEAFIRAVMETIP